MLNSQTAGRAAARGARLLEQLSPGSVARIDLDTLDVAEPNVCPLAQAFNRDYEEAVDIVFPYNDDATESGWNAIRAQNRRAAYHGFSVDWNQIEGSSLTATERLNHAYKLLTTAWKRQVRLARRAAKKAQVNG